MVAMGGSHNISQVDQGAATGEHLHCDGGALRPLLGFLPEEGGEGELAGQGVLASHNPLLSPTFSTLAEFRQTRAIFRVAGCAKRMKNWNRVLGSPAFGIGSLAAHCLCDFIANSLLNALKKVCVLRSALLIIFQLALLLCEARALLLRGANLSQAAGFAANSALFLVAN